MATYKVLAKRVLSDNTYVLRIERPEFKILSGQCFSLGTQDLAINREYSMYSSSNDDYIDFLIRKIPGGRVSSRLYELEKGDEVQMNGPYGEFCLPTEEIESNEYLFIASGTGIAPFHSFALTHENLKYKLIHGIRLAEEAYDKEDYSKSSYLNCISRPENGKNGRKVTDYLLENDLNLKSKVYLCGNRNMITDAIGILRAKGFGGEAIFTETFF